MPSRHLLIAIDGPAGAGKSAAARELAVRLRLPYLDTGAMYRAVALLAVRSGIGPHLDEPCRVAVVAIASALRVSFCGDPRAQRVLLDGEDVTEELRTPAVSQMASVVSALPAVRREMVARQREIVASSGGVVEGRDIGTVVFPDAPLKVFLTARPEVRAKRRFDELTKRGVPARWEDVLAEQHERDRRDSTRSDSPLRPADSAFVVDTSAMSLAEVVTALLALVPWEPV
ncbi:MAG: (d)CMP kinase [Thermoanaerobaculales bacterium]